MRESGVETNQRFRRIAWPWKAVLWAGVLGLLVWARMLIWQVFIQLLLGMLVAMLALPLMRRLERRLPVGAAASLSMIGLSAALIAALLLLAPPIMAQARQLASILPTLFARLAELAGQATDWLSRNGVTVEAGARDELLAKGRDALTGALPSMMRRAGGAAEGLGKLFFAPVFSFYFLRDRKRIGAWMTTMLPFPWREPAVFAMREMRREASGFLRGQLMVSGAVAALTSLGLLLCGVPAWLLLGVVMGVMEIIPYVGPFLGGAMVFLFSLQGGLSRLLWAMAVVVTVQQLEGGMLSPKLMSEATRLHPIVVLLLVMTGGMAGGVAGVLASVPLALCFRAAARVISLALSGAAAKKP